MFPDEINKIIRDFNVVEIRDFHRSGDIVYNVECKYILKVSDNISRLEEEFNKDNWISSYIPSPKPILFLKENNKAFYLREYLDGENLCTDKYINNPTLLVDLLVDAIKLLHSVKVDNKKFVVNADYSTLIHGDFCLPNILIKDNKVVGFIDLGDSGIGDPWCDYAWCIWSLEYNLHTKNYTRLFLNKLGIEFNQYKFDYYTK